MVDGVEDHVYEAEDIVDRRVVAPRKRNGRRRTEYLVRWKGYADPEWVQEVDLNCGGLLFDFQQRYRTGKKGAVLQRGSGREGTPLD